VLAGTGSLSKTNTGTLVLTGNSAIGFTGATTVSAGTLVVNGSIAGSSVAVAGGTLAGSGRVGAINLTTGALSPGEGTSAAVLNASATTLAGGTLSMDILGTGAAGTAYDQLKVTGTVTLSSNIELILTLGPAFTYTPNSTFTLIDNDGGDALAGTGRFTVGGVPIADNGNFQLGGNTWTLDYNGGDGNDVVLLTIPEPASASCLLAGMGGLLGLRRLRRTR
jgi:autotransporter-associated beta strand protein